MSILKDLYYGEIKPSEKYVKKGSEYQKLSNQLIEHINELKESLNDKEKQLCEKITDDNIALNVISEREFFTEGFCTGAKMMWEILNYKSNNFIDF